MYLYALLDIEEKNMITAHSWWIQKYITLPLYDTHSLLPYTSKVSHITITSICIRTYLNTVSDTYSAIEKYLYSLLKLDWLHLLVQSESAS